MPELQFYRRTRKLLPDENVMQALEQIPDQDYASPVAVSREVGKLH